MERKDLPDILFKKMNEVVAYNINKVRPVENMLDQTGFFPGCKGLWLGNKSTDFPTMLVLGHDFSNVEYYEELIDHLTLEM